MNTTITISFTQDATLYEFQEFLVEMQSLSSKYRHVVLNLEVDVR